nr:hypothetical protein [Streptomyces antibioticus]
MEKPLALDASEAARIAELASARGLFCAEALWTLYLPKFDVVRQFLESGVLGDIHTVLAEPGDLALTPSGGGTTLAYTEPRTAHEGLQFEAAEVAQCVSDGQLQTPLRPLADSLTMLQAKDELRRTAGIRRPTAGEAAR